MASIEERQTTRGTSYVVIFYRGGRRLRVFLDSGYSRADAEHARLAIQGFINAERRGEPIDRRTRVYFETAPADLIRRFSSLGFDVASKQMTVREIWTAFREHERGTVKESSIVHRETVFNRFRAFFPQDVRFPELTSVALQRFREELVKHYAPTTVAKSIVDLRTFGNWAVAHGYTDANPFKDLPTGPTGNRSRDFQVPAEWTERILAACPSQCWRTLYCLWRHAGLRQQEPMLLTRDSIDLASRKLRVYATKTERYLHGGFRTVPIVPVLANELERQLSEIPRGESYLIYENRRKAFDRGFQYILMQAGLARWEKTFQNLRSSCENDWIADGIPSHVVADWLGHSVRTQEAYYLRVLPEYFERVTRNEISHATPDDSCRGTSRGTG